MKGLRSLGRILPSLRVIGGRDLISNYAFIVYQNQDLEQIGLPELREIRRGGVRIQNNEQLCGAGNTNWSVITGSDAARSGAASGLSPVPVDIKIKQNGDPNKCDAQCRPPTPADQEHWDAVCEVNYKSKKRDYACLTKDDCQPRCADKCARTEEGKLLGGCQDLDPYACCDDECTGGCIGPGPSKCYACRNVFHGGKCIPACPKQLYLIENRRCVTREQCLAKPPRQAYMRNPGHFKPLAYPGQPRICDTKCPKHYTEDPADPRQCTLCRGPCKRRCARANSDPILSIQALEELKDCQIIESNLTLQITGIKDNLSMTLEECLGEIIEIEGYLSITSNPLITSLSFFKKLERIRGRGLFKGKYALAINENENLRMLFPPKHPKVVIGSKGSTGTKRAAIHVHNNPMLCYSHVLETARNNSWIPPGADLDPDDVSKSSNGDKTVCVNAEMKLKVEADADYAILSWDQFNDSDIDHRNFLGYKLYYKELGEDEEPDMFSGNDACSETWQMRFMGTDERGDIISNLSPNTRYAFYVKTSVSHHYGAKGAISKIVVVRTHYKAPRPPRLLSSVHKEDYVKVVFLPPGCLPPSLLSSLTHSTWPLQSSPTARSRTTTSSTPASPTRSPSSATTASNVSLVSTLHK